MKIIGALARSASAWPAQRKRRAILIVALALLGLIGWIDYVTSVELSLAAFYWIPVAMVTWYYGARIGYCFAAASVALQMGGDIAGGLVHSGPLFLLWDVATRLLSLAILVWMLAKIKQLYEEARKVSQLEIDLQSTRAAYRELQAFNYVISHNLHAPLRSIMGYSQVVLENYADRLDAEGRDYLNRVQESGRKMVDLINALIELVEISGGELHPENVDLSALVESIAEELKLRAPSRTVTWNLEPGITATGDRRLLRIALHCLLDNAWKFTAPQPAPSIAFGLMQPGEHPVYYVRDNGVGFNMTYAGKLFTPFQSVHKPGEFEGLGIGLSMAERIIRRHAGKLWAEAAQGRGATFYFTLP